MSDRYLFRETTVTRAVRAFSKATGVAPGDTSVQVGPDGSVTVQAVKDSESRGATREWELPDEPPSAEVRP